MDIISTPSSGSDRIESKPFAATAVGTSLISLFLLKKKIKKHIKSLN